MAEHSIYILMLKSLFVNGEMYKKEAAEFVQDKNITKNMCKLQHLYMFFVSYFT